MHNEELGIKMKINIIYNNIKNVKHFEIDLTKAG